MEFQVSLAPKAKQDLAQIGRFIALDDVEAAHHFCDELFQAAKSLRHLPQRGPVFNRQRNVRRFIYKSYLIFYKIDEEVRTVKILRFWHAAQDRRRLRLQEASPQYSISGNTA